MSYKSEVNFAWGFYKTHKPADETMLKFELKYNSPEHKNIKCNGGA